MTATGIEDDGPVRHLVLCRGDEYNTITPEFRDELGTELDDAEGSDTVKVALLRAEGKAFCAGFGLDWSTITQADESDGETKAWDSVPDVRMIARYGNTFAKLHEISKPTVATVHGWCVAGGTDMILNADIVLVTLPSNARSDHLRQPVDVAGVVHPSPSGFQLLTQPFGPWLCSMDSPSQVDGLSSPWGQCCWWRTSAAIQLPNASTAWVVDLELPRHFGASEGALSVREDQDWRTTCLRTRTGARRR